MNAQHKALSDCLTELGKRPYVDAKVLKMFTNRLSGDPRLVRDDGTPSHFCTFFTPVCLKEKKIYIGHHKKSDSWLAPGGHIDKDETPVQTIIRESREELGADVSQNRIELFNLVHFVIPGRRECTEHFDIWYLVFFNSLMPFVYEEKEFYDAGWYAIGEALKKKSLPGFHNELKLLEQNMEEHSTSIDS